jgi:pantothenate kinase
MALTNHAVVKLAASKIGLPYFEDYLVLGDDIVIARKEVAECYRHLIVSIGVGISLHKRIHPSSLQGVEFASKLTTSYGNIRPLPIALLLDQSVVSKLQFLSKVWERVVQEGIQDVPTLDILFKSVFGNKQGERLGLVWREYYHFRSFLKLARSEAIDLIKRSKADDTDKTVIQASQP